MLRLYCVNVLDVVVENMPDGLEIYPKTKLLSMVSYEDGLC